MGQASEAGELQLLVVQRTKSLAMVAADAKSVTISTDPPKTRQLPLVLVQSLGLYRALPNTALQEIVYV